MLFLLNNCYSPNATGRFFRNYAMKKEIIKKCEKQRITLKNKLDEDRALRLINGDRKYKQFTREEKRIVNALQKKIDQQDGGLTLPNTKKHQDFIENLGAKE